MRKWIRAAMPVAVGLMLMGLASCEGDEGPQGPPGVATCMNCHTDDFQLADYPNGWYLRSIQTQFVLSRHNLSDTYVRRGTDASPTCSRCHTTEGFQVYIATGDEAPLEESSHIGCFACHAPHTNEDFSLRKQGPQEMFIGQTYDEGNSNTCAVCHQARALEPGIESQSPITSTRWGPHYGPQSNILSGQGAWDLPGTDFDAAAVHPHNTANSQGCVTCHMADLPDNTIAGGHSFAPDYETSEGDRINSKGCACHGFNDADATEYTEELFMTPFEEDLNELRALLDVRQWLDTSGTYASNGANAPGPGNPRGAVLNYLLLHHDKSMGVHNPNYARAVLDGTKAWLEANP